MANRDTCAGWLLLQQLRGVYLAHDHVDATGLLDDWILAALESGMEPFARTALTLDTHRTEIANAITLGLSNARLEGMNSTVRLISHRARGFRRLDSLLSMMTLVCGRIPVELPTITPEEPTKSATRVICCPSATATASAPGCAQRGR